MADEDSPALFRDRPRAFQERYYYDRLARLFYLRFGEHRRWVGGAWASAREAGLSPVVALRHIFFFFIGRPHDQWSDEGRLLDEICNAWAWGKNGGRFRTAYVRDFANVLATPEAESADTGKLPAALAVPIDLWSLRQAGKIDDEFRELLDEVGVEAPSGPLATATPSDPYELTQAFFIARAAALNAKRPTSLDGWTALQGEAAGRFELQERLDLEPLTADEIFDEANLDG